MLRSEIEHVHCALAQTALLLLFNSTEMCKHESVVQYFTPVVPVVESHLVQGRGCLVPTGHVSTLQRCR